jgi:hypothetical protein
MSQIDSGPIEEYRGFLISRADSEYILYRIETLEGGPPPLDLRGDFTTRTRAKEHLAAWWVKKSEREARETKKK